MRASAQWYRRAASQYALPAAARGVVHLRHYASEFVTAGDGEPLVLVPGLAGGHELIGRLVRVLARRFRVICFELRGEHDPMHARQPCHLTDLADDLADFLDALLLEKPAVAGISFGSAVALQCALRHSGRLGALVVHGIEPHFRSTLGRRVAQLVLERYPLPHDSAFVNQFFRLLFARREPVGRLLDYVTACCWSTDQSVMAQRLALLTDFDIRDRLAALDVPTLVIAGADDAIVGPAGQRALASSIPRSRFVSLARAGHLCFLTRPKAFAQHIGDFLRHGHATGERPKLDSPPGHR